MVKLTRDGSDPQHHNEIYRFFEYSLDLFAIAGFDGYLKRVNPAWERTLGYTAEELFSKPIIGFIHPEDRAASMGLLEQISAGEPLINFENRYLCKDGSIKWLEWTAHAYPDEGVIYMVGRDVTERKQAQEALRQSEQRLRQSEATLREFIDALPGITVVTDLEGNLHTFNEQFAKRYRKPDVELESQNIYDLLSPTNAEGRRPYAQMVVESGKPVHFQSEGRGRFFDITLFPIFDGQQEVVRLGSFFQDVTDVKQAEVELRRSQHYIRLLIENLPVIVFAFDSQGIVTLSDGNALVAQGFKPGQVVGQSIFDLYRDDPITVNSFRRVLNGESLSSTRAYGDLTLVAFYEPVFDRDGSVEGVIGITIDFTEQVSAHQALERSEKTLRELLNGSQDMAYLTDVEGRLIAFNKKFSELLGVLPEGGLNLNVFDILPPDAAVMDKSIVNRVLSTRQPVQEEIEYSGQFFEYSVHPIMNDANEVVSLATFAHDITRRKQTELKLRNSEAQFRSVLESAAEGILLTDSTGAILLVNRRVEELFGYTREELFGQSVDMLLVDAQRTLHAAHRQDYYAEPASRSMGIGMEVFGQRKDGSMFPIEVSLSYMRNDGELQVMALVSDISERKQIEQERLDNQRIQLEVNQEREIIALRQQFMSMVSHEFRTPLTVIASSTEILQHYDDRLSRERRMEKLQVINGQVRAMVTLLDDILALNKIQAGVSDFSPETLDLLALCMTILNNVKIMDQDRHHFIFDSQSASTPILADRRLLEHCITNLLSNAVKYSPPETSIRLSLSSNGNSVNLEVGDQGIGIPVEDQQHLFEPFYRAHNARKIDGTGLGLAIVKHNVEQHGGTITCRSAEGKGTTFSIHLPIATST